MVMWVSVPQSEKAAPDEKVVGVDIAGADANQSYLRVSGPLIAV